MSETLSKPTLDPVRAQEWIEGPRAALITTEIRADYVKWSEENPSVALAASMIGPAVGIGQIAAAQVIELYKDFVS